MKIQKLGFIGGGRVTKIFLQAFTNKSVKFDSIVVYDPNVETLNELKKQFPAIKVSDSVEMPAKEEFVFLAVHPPVMMETLGNIKQFIQPGATVLSLAPKFTISKISETLGLSTVIRMIPNATSFINEGYNPVSFQTSIKSTDKELFINKFKILGDTFEVEENKLEAYAIVSAMLPTYFWFQWQKMFDIAVKTGLQEKEAIQVLENTLLKSIKLFYESGLNPAEVIDLIPVKPIGENEKEIENILETKLMGLFSKIKP